MDSTDVLVFLPWNPNGPVFVVCIAASSPLTWHLRTDSTRVSYANNSSGLIHIINVARGLVPAILDDKYEPYLPLFGQTGQVGTVLTYADLTRDVSPKPCHSHNDYWRRVPLLDALRAGCTGVEADVWLMEDDLFVGHDTRSLKPGWTFRKLYLDPLVEMLNHRNPRQRLSGEIKNGVFEQAPLETLVLLVDLKTSGPETLAFVEEQISILRDSQYLSYFDGSSVHKGPITVVATGNAPFDVLTSNTTYRDIFFDAPLAEMFEEPVDMIPGRNGEIPPLSPPPKARKRAHQSHVLRGASGQGTVGTTAESSFNTTNSYYASVSFKKSIGHVWSGRLSAGQMRLIRGQIQGAKKRGLKVRYWGVPSWPIGLRNYIWDVLVKEGVDYLNGDDLQAMTRMDWSKRRHHGFFW